jgi:hypothetical protein
MQVGDFSLELRPETPKSIRDAVRSATLDRSGYVCTFNTPTTTPTLAAALSVGWLTQRTGIYRFGGIDLAGVLQSNDNLGEHVTKQTAYAAQTLSAWFDDLLPFGGITKGTVTNTGTSPALVHKLGLGLREMIDYVCAQAGAVWRVNTDGTIDADSHSNDGERAAASSSPSKYPTSLLDAASLIGAPRYASGDSLSSTGAILSLGARRGAPPSLSLPSSSIPEHYRGALASPPAPGNGQLGQGPVIAYRIDSHASFSEAFYRDLKSPIPFAPSDSHTPIVSSTPSAGVLPRISSANAF